MKTIQQAMLEEIYTKAVKLSHQTQQAVHDEKSDIDGNYYITIAQLEIILGEFEG